MTTTTTKYKREKKESKKRKISAQPVRPNRVKSLVCHIFSLVSMLQILTKKFELLFLSRLYDKFTPSVLTGS